MLTDIENLACKYITKTVIEYYDGNIKQKMYTLVNFTREGIYEYYARDGSIRHRYNYCDGLQHGEQIYFGVGKTIYYYNHGVLEKVISYLENGNINEFRLFKNGKSHGKSYTYDEFTNITELTNWCNGKKHGLYKKYIGGRLTGLSYTGGKLVEMKTYIHDLLHGKWVDYEKGISGTYVYGVKK